MEFRLGQNIKKCKLQSKIGLIQQESGKISRCVSIYNQAGKTYIDCPRDGRLSAYSLIKGPACTPQYDSTTFIGFQVVSMMQRDVSPSDSYTSD